MRAVCLMTTFGLFRALLLSSPLPWPRTTCHDWQAGSLGEQLNHTCAAGDSLCRRAAGFFVLCKAADWMWPPLAVCACGPVTGGPGLHLTRDYWLKRQCDAVANRRVRCTGAHLLCSTHLFHSYDHGEPPNAMETGRKKEESERKKEALQVG